MPGTADKTTKSAAGRDEQDHVTSRMAEIARLKVEIDEVTPAVIRRIEVPVTIRLDDLHFVLQIAIGWQNCHPFEFRVGDAAADSNASDCEASDCKGSESKVWGLRDRDDP